MPTPTPRLEAESLWRDASVVSTEPEMGEAAPAAFLGRLDEQAKLLPEVADKRETLATTGATLIDRFQINPSFFDDEAASLVFTAVADRFANLDQVPDSHRTFQGELLVDLMATLVNENSQVLKTHLDEQDDVNTDLHRELTKRVHEKYTDRQLSQEMTAAINNGLLADVKERLGITAETEEPFEVRVLSVDPSGIGSRGLSAPITQWEDLPGNEEEKQARAAEEQELFRDVRQHQKGLVTRAKSMGEEIGEDITGWYAWVTYLGSERTQTLCITMPLAEKFLYPELTRNSETYDEHTAAQDRAILEHEYVHTQGSLSVNDSDYVGIGIGLEERRAELFAGDKMGYTDVKAFWSDVALITGFNVTKLMTGLPKGGTPMDIYPKLAELAGLEGMLHMLVAQPNAYRQYGGPLTASLASWADSYDRISERLLEAEKERGNGAEVQQRIDRVAAYLKDAPGAKDWFMGRAHDNIQFVSKLVGESLTKLKDQQ